MKRSLSVIILILIICQEVYTWTLETSKKDVSYQDAQRFCKKEGMGLPGELSNEERLKLTSYMEANTINYTWISLKRKMFHRYKSTNKKYTGSEPVILGQQRAETCLVLTFKQSGNRILRATGCFSTLPAICETTLCDWCPHWNCGRTPSGCLKLIRGAPSWFHARAECVRLGGTMWVNSSYNPNDINWPDLKESVKPKEEVWLGWRNVDWSYTQEPDEIRPPTEFYLKESSSTDCVLQTVDPYRWKAVSCNTAATALCWRRGILNETSTAGILTTTRVANGKEEPIADPCKDTSVNKYHIIFSVVAAVCVIISVLSVACCIRLATRVRKHNLMRYNQEDKVRKEDSGKGIIASTRRSARGLSQIYTEIFDIQGRTLPRTPSEQHYAVSRTPIKEATSENENDRAQKPRSELGVYLKQDPIDGLQYSAQATGTFTKGVPRKFKDHLLTQDVNQKARGDVSVYVKQKQTVS